MQEVQNFIQQYMEPEDHLEHHGIKGQKWGVRRYQNYDGTRIGAKKLKPAKKEDTNEKKAHEDYHEKSYTLSDDELNKRIKRMENEIKYNKQQDILYPDKKKARRERLKRIFVDSAVTAASKTMESVYTEIGKRLLDGIGLAKNNSGQNQSGNKNKQKQNNDSDQNQNKNPNVNEKKDTEDTQKKNARDFVDSIKKRVDNHNARRDEKREKEREAALARQEIERARQEEQRERDERWNEIRRSGQEYVRRERELAQERERKRGRKR